MRLEAGGVLIFGDGGSGKTSTMWRFMVEAGGPYISNDRCLVSTDGSEGFCIGYPFAVRLGAGFIKSVPDRGRIATSARHRTQVECVTRSLPGTVSEVDQWATVAKLELTTLELAVRTGCGIAPGAAIPGVFYAQLGATGEAPAARPISGNSAAQVFERNILSPGSVDYPPPWLKLQHSKSEGFEQACGELAWHFAQPALDLPGRRPAFRTDSAAAAGARRPASGLRGGGAIRHFTARRLAAARS